MNTWIAHDTISKNRIRYILNSLQIILKNSYIKQQQPHKKYIYHKINVILSQLNKSLLKLLYIIQYSLCSALLKKHKVYLYFIIQLDSYLSVGVNIVNNIGNQSLPTTIKTSNPYRKHRVSSGWFMGWRLFHKMIPIY